MTRQVMPRPVAQIVEAQIGRWRAEDADRVQVDVESTEPLVPANVITISRAAGTYGDQVALEVGEMLRMPVYDRKIVEHIASEARVTEATVSTLDERTQNRLDAYLTALVRERNFDQTDYSQALSRAIMGLWGHGPCVLIGRGAHQIIYRKNSLSVRLTAPLTYRVRFSMYAENLDEKTVTDQINRDDAERTKFVRRHYGVSIDDATQYDMVLNVTGLRGTDCAALVAEAYRRKFAA